MASITLCPRCSSHLELPTGIAPTSLVECPICEAEFLLASVAPRPIPKVRVVEQALPDREESPAEEPVAESAAPTTFSIVADEEAMPAEAVASAEERLSRLLRSSANWQISGHDSLDDASRASEGDDDDSELQDEAADAEVDASDDLVIPNDHARAATFGETLDAAYRDADPATAAAAAPADELQLAGSRLDQLLSDLMKPQTLAAKLPPAGPTASEPTVAPPPFGEFYLAPADQAEELDEEEPLEGEFAVVAEDDPSASDGSFEDRWRRLQAGDDQPDDSSEREAFEPAADYFADESSEHDEAASIELRTAPSRRRRPAGVRTLVGIVGGGVIGILGGAYALLWLRGPDVDVLSMADWLPPAMLPASMRSTPTASVADHGLPAHHRLAEPSAARNLDAAAPLPTTLTFAEPDAEGPLGAPDADDPASGETDLQAATPPRRGAIINDADVSPASAVEPVVEAPPATPPAAESVKHWPTTPIVGQLRSAALFSVADLDLLLADADAAHRRFLAGDLARKEDVAGMGQAYIELCKAAERFTLLDPAEYGNELINKQLIAKDIFRGVAGLPARRNDLAMIAGRWLQHGKRPNQGVVLLGKVADLQARGPWTEYTIETPLGDSTAVSKALIDGMPFASGAEVAIVGTIVADPRHAIAGYDGEAPQVIVSGFAFTPEEFAAPKVGGLSSDPSDLFSFGE
jgi:hypothetical protein